MSADSLSPFHVRIVFGNGAGAEAVVAARSAGVAAALLCDRLRKEAGGASLGLHEIHVSRLADGMLDIAAIREKSDDDE